MVLPAFIGMTTTVHGASCHTMGTASAGVGTAIAGLLLTACAAESQQQPAWHWEKPNVNQTQFNKDVVVKMCGGEEAAIEQSLAVRREWPPPEIHASVTRMEYTPGRGYYAVDGPPLRGGLRAAIGSGE